ncbi:hypothetical protein HanLR1_Chr17g0670271 [Helianthus annuus]|nr:hypothetical protein HanHA89_Chr17g0711701 [Helianthus annuus]KAJ0632890.1 hypothetical protein HanLR1_Chr17g0670271 [Helianthus annuus]
MYAVQVMNFMKTLITKTLREREDAVIESSRGPPQEPSLDKNGDQGPRLSPHVQQNHDENEVKKAGIIFAFGAPVTGDHTFNQIFRRPLIFVPATVTFDRITLIYHSHFMVARIWMTRAARVRSSVWRVSSRRPGGDVEKWIDVIRIGLEGITVNDANKSFNGVCSRLEDMLDSLSTLLSENSVLNKDELLQLAFAAIQLVNSTRNY